MSAHLLPGALQKNAGFKFLCETVELRVETTTTALTNQAHAGDVLRHSDFRGRVTVERPVSPRKRHAIELFEGLPRRYDELAAALSFWQDPRWRRAMVATVAASSRLAS